MVLKVKPNAAKPRTDPLRGDDLKAKQRFIFLQYFPQREASTSLCFTQSCFRKAASDFHALQNQASARTCVPGNRLTTVQLLLNNRSTTAQRPCPFSIVCPLFANGLPIACRCLTLFCSFGYPAFAGDFYLAFAAAVAGSLVCALGRECHFF